MEFPDSPNDPDKDSLPDPKLNPLLNPLLAAHMGRWAEVYFTSPPEKRDEAVAELLRELAREEQSSPAEYAAQAAAAETARPKAPEPHIATMEPPHNEYSAEPEARELVCRECGHHEDIFGHGGAKEAAERLGYAFLGEIPLDTRIRAESDSGQPVALDGATPQGKAFHEVAAAVEAQLAAAQTTEEIVIE